MHEIDVPSCDHCQKFVFAFPEDSPLADWGFCLHEFGGVLPGEDVRQGIEVAFKNGDYGKVYGMKGLCEGEEEGCEQFVAR